VGSPPRAVALDNEYDRYHALDPETFPRTARTAYKMNELKLARLADAEGLHCIWHSHCDAGAYFSAEDRAVALGGADEPLWPGVEYLVVSVKDGRAVEARAFRWDPERSEFSARDVPLP
jgi:proteasome lid subunit RPN8/RPN11